MIQKIMELLRTVKPKESITFEMDLTTLCAYFDACAQHLLEDVENLGESIGRSNDEIYHTLFLTTTTLTSLKMWMCDKGNFERCARENERMNKEDLFNFESEV